jgi:hypothetical protein
MDLDFTALTGALGALKALTGIAKDVNNVEFNQRLVEIQQKLLDVQVSFGQILDANRKAEIEAAKATIFHHSVYWKKLPEGEDGPFCPICFGDKGKFMPLAFHGPNTMDKNLVNFQCPVQHVAPGQGRQPSYKLPKEFVPENRYAKWS